MIKMLRRIARPLGMLIDEEDRKVVGAGLVMALAFMFGASTIGAGVGLALRFFEIARG